MDRTAHFLKPITLLTVALFSGPSVFAGSSSLESFLISATIPMIAASYSSAIGDKEGGKELVLASLVTLQANTFLRYSIHRTRPDGGNDLSFPSGRVSGAFTGASYMHHRYGVAWGLPLYIAGAVMGYERVNVKKNYWSDVVAGAALGYLSGAFFTVRYPGVWRIEPQFDSQGKASGIQFKMDFH